MASVAAQDLAMNKSEKPVPAKFNKASSNDNTVEPDVTIMAKASDHSKTGEIGVFVIAGTELSHLTDEQLNEKFDKIMEKTGIGIELKIQRTNKRKGSTYDFFVDGQSVGSTVGYKDLKQAMRVSINRHNNNRGIASNFTP